MDQDRLRAALRDGFDATAGERRVVVRAALDLADARRFREIRGRRLTPAIVVEELDEAPAALGLVERWNWWIGALDLAHGGFDDFRVRRWREG